MRGGILERGITRGGLLEWRIDRVYEDLGNRDLTN
jgi:hypothetical protein